MRRKAGPRANGWETGRAGERVGGPLRAGPKRNAGQAEVEFGPRRELGRSGTAGREREEWAWAVELGWWVLEPG